MKYQKIILILSVIREDEDLDWKLYKMCVEWWKQTGIRTIADLKDRIIDHESYKIKWIERCKKRKIIHRSLKKWSGYILILDLNFSYTFFIVCL